MSAFAASDTLLSVFWTIPLGMSTVGRMLMSVAQGEEDRQTLKYIFRILMTRCVLIEIVIAAFIMVMSVPFTSLYYHDPSAPVYDMTVMAFRIIPLAMPLGLIAMTWTGYAQVMGKQVLIHTLSLLDGALCICLWAMALVPVIGMNGVYIAVVINAVVTALYPVLFSLVVNRGKIRTTDELLMIPDSFGVTEEERLDLSLRSYPEAVNISRTIQSFCLDRGIDHRRSFLSALCLEEMAITIIDIGFAKDPSAHSVDVRVVHKDDSIIMRIKDDCSAMNPEELAKIVDSDDITKNIGVRTVYKIAEEISYQNILGLNVLTIKM